MKFKMSLLALSFTLICGWAQGQKKEASPFDFGKMWTFENPPKAWFNEAYNFNPDDQWFKDVRMSSLRFASWCSASFVSPNGLIMTNHHCSRDVVGALQQAGENFDKQGFHAKTYADERKAEGLFVEQLVEAKDITDEVFRIVDNGNDQFSRDEAIQNALKTLEEQYKARPDWQGLRTQLVTYYSGGRFALYGYKRYDDIRLVLLPEVDLGFYGGDPDNFTYPRYNLDCTFWRAYDENGKPLNTEAHYFQFNENGVKDGEVTFVVGNPGSTERYRTVSQLKWDRDLRYPMQYRFLSNRVKILNEEYDLLKNDPSKEMEAQAKLNMIANVANGEKAIGGIIKGMNDPLLFDRKIEMEQYIRQQSGDGPYWDELNAEYEKLYPHTWPMMHLGPSGLRGKVLLLMHQLYNYEDQVKNGAEQAEIDETLQNINDLSMGIHTKDERKLFNLLLDEIEADIYPGDNTLTQLYGGQTKEKFVTNMYNLTLFKKGGNPMEYMKNLDSKKHVDPILKAARLLVPKQKAGLAAFGASSAKRKSLEQKIANQAFKVHGTSLPPDATFTLRISDGIVKGYNYNGTTAPIMTTYYGLYDRHYSHGQEFPWSLPEKWMNPSQELLKSPLNYVSTNDIIGGNSGSPMINKNKECIGLIFDGNIESLPGNFIFDEEFNRTVSVHAGGIVAAMRYVYNAERIVNELVGEKK